MISMGFDEARGAVGARTSRMGCKLPRRPRERDMDLGISFATAPRRHGVMNVSLTGQSVLMECRRLPDGLPTNHVIPR